METEIIKEINGAMVLLVIAIVVGLMTSMVMIASLWTFEDREDDENV